MTRTCRGRTRPELTPSAADVSSRGDTPERRGRRRRGRWPAPADCEVKYDFRQIRLSAHTCVRRAVQPLLEVGQSGRWPRAVKRTGCEPAGGYAETESPLIKITLFPSRHVHLEEHPPPGDQPAPDDSDGGRWAALRSGDRRKQVALASDGAVQMEGVRRRVLESPKEERLGGPKIRAGDW